MKSFLEYTKSIALLLLDEKVYHNIITLMQKMSIFELMVFGVICKITDKMLANLVTYGALIYAQDC